MDQDLDEYDNSNKIEKRKDNEVIKKDKKKKKRKKLLLSEDNNEDWITEEQSKQLVKKDRYYTVSIAVPSSVVETAQTLELKTYLIGQIARTATIFCVDEIIVFVDSARQNNHSDESHEMMCSVLEYLECPQYLRKYLYPFHRFFKFAGIINPLRSPSHLLSDDVSKFREGIVLETLKEKNSLINVGIEKNVVVDKVLLQGIRVTVELDLEKQDKKYLIGKIVSLNTPKKKTGTYWTYTVRAASSVTAAIEECPFKKKYDLIIGTSDKGNNVDQITFRSFKHLLIVFGGRDGLEACLEGDHTQSIKDPFQLFHYYVNTCPNQGSHTIRTEEAILITLSSLRPKILSCQSS